MSSEGWLTRQHVGLLQQGHDVHRPIVREICQADEFLVGFG